MRKTFTYLFTLATLLLSGTSLWAQEAPKADDEGYLLIGTPDEFQWFAKQVTENGEDPNVRLTADLDMTGITLPTIGKPSDNTYEGNFDGQGHTISNLTVTGDGVQGNQTGIGLFKRKTKGTITRTILRDITINVTVDDEHPCDYAGGFVGNQRGSSVLSYCAVLGLKVIPSDPEKTISVGGLNAYISSNENNKVIACFTDAEKILGGYGSKSIRTNDFAGEDVENLKGSGELCYKLNEGITAGWYQTLGEDEYPVLDNTHKEVFVATDMTCDGTPKGDVIYSNTPGIRDAHTYENGICTVCNYLNPEYITPVDGAFPISAADQLIWFSAYVKAGNTSANARLTADIDMGGKLEDGVPTQASPAFTPIGNTDYPFQGVFDGQDHIIKNLVITSSDSYVGLFGRVTGTAAIKNFVIDSNSYIGGASYVGIIGATRNSASTIVIDRVGMEGAVVASGINAGGILGCNMDGPATTISNCYVTGAIQASDQAGQINGWFANGIIENCWATGSIEGVYNKTENAGDGFYRGSPAVVRNNYSNALYKNASVLDFNEEDAKSGLMTFTLNGDQSQIKWYQNLGEGGDALPSLNPSHKKVYANGHISCGGEPLGNVTYSNDPSGMNQDPHEFKAGVCTVCGFVDANFCQKDEDGYYMIDNGEKLAWFASMVNAGLKDPAARLTADIDMSDVNDIFPMIGTTATPFKSGKFDGQSHIISGLNINRPMEDNVGLFGCITGNCDIRNFVLDQTCVIVGKAHTAAIGATVSAEGTVYITAVGNEGTVQGGQNTGAIFGCEMGAAATVYIDKCYSTGSVIGTVESGALTGYISKGYIRNSWSSATIEGYYASASKPFALCYCETKNNYVVHTDLNASFDIKGITNEQVYNGELCYMLNGGSLADPIWFQSLGSDEHPVLDNTHGIVYSLDDMGSIEDNATFATFLDKYKIYMRQYADDAIATQSLLDEFKAMLDNIGNPTTLDEFIPTYKELSTKLAEVETSVTAYEAYKAKLDYVTEYLANDDSFWGNDRDLLTDYLESDEAPDETFTNGGSHYILENHLLTTEEIIAETAKVQKMLEDAIKNGYGKGAEVTSMIKNPQFANGLENWTVLEGRITTGGQPGMMQAAEAIHTNFNYQQTITGLTNGVYEIRMNGVSRCLPLYQNPSYTTIFYANDNKVFLKNYFDEYQEAETAEDGVNCNLTVPYADLSLTDIEGNVYGYVPQGHVGGSFHFTYGRYENVLVANVTDGTLTIGCMNTGTGNSGDWALMSNFRLFYLGDLEDASMTMDKTLAEMLKRAEMIQNYTPDQSDFTYYPNYSASLQSDLQNAMAEVESAVEPADKMALIAKFSSIFAEILPSRLAYRTYAKDLESYYTFMDNIHTAGAIDDDTFGTAQVIYYNIWDKLVAGDYTTAEAEAEEDLKNAAYYTNAFGKEPELVDGFYQIAEGANLVWFAKKVNSGNYNLNAVLTADIDLTGFSLDVICPDGTYTGTFDGQGHTISNLTIETDKNYTGMFGIVGPGARIQNFVLDSTCSIIGGSYTAIIGGTAATAGDVYITAVGNEGYVKGIKNTGAIFGCEMSAAATVYIDRCYSSGTVIGDNESGALTGYIKNGYIRNSWSSATIEGYYTSASKPFSLCYCETKNNYIVHTDLNTSFDIKGITIEQVASGELCYLLNQNSGVETPIWFQTLGEDEHPVLDNTHGVVAKDENGNFTNEKGDIHLGTEEDPFVVKSASDMVNLLNLLVPGRMNYVVMEADVDLAGTEWKPLFNYAGANDTYPYPFIDFDGKNHVIRNLTSKTDGAYDYCGLFGVLCGNVRNLGVENADVTSTGGTGIIAGYLGHSKYGKPCYVENVWVTGKLSATGYCGGMFGNVADESHILNCYANVEVTGESDLTGGIIGRVRGFVDMIQVYAAGSINRGGGIIGGGQQDATPLGSYKHIAVWNNTENNFGPTRADEDLRQIIYYDGSNFAAMQSEVVAWDPAVWSCDMAEGSYPVLKAFTTGVGSISAPALSGDIYDLSGRKLMTLPRKGVYIQNGKKVLVK